MKSRFFGRSEEKSRHEPDRGKEKGSRKRGPEKRRVLPLAINSFPAFSLKTKADDRERSANSLTHCKPKVPAKIIGGCDCCGHSDFCVEEMEKGTGNGGSGGQTPSEFGRQSIVVNVKDRKFLDGRKRVSAPVETKSVLLEDHKNKRISEKNLLDSYNQAFQKHVDNLNNVISQHRGEGVDENVGAAEEKATGTGKPVPLAPLSRLEIKTDGGVNQVVTFGPESDEDLLERISSSRQKRFNVVDLQEETLFEALVEPNPMITFNHVCTEETADKIGFHQVKSSSRSPSPMLEVPDSKKREKITTRPPLQG